ncbi:MAG: T9SS type A sorting domain-containing protein, partial [Flavobacteriales bacterium]|nr:T9SS type A sorting domain-containing protein [Flavobacteriales bacterium]MCW8914151.1 T9SS type A sorting domain-containing protein [Flavobacteriales bacterium]MCW8969028.1 T9SS type A sorting domain-containing protein [Flavobacteriales bacterium]
MKKIYLCAIALSIGSFSFGQSVMQKTFSNAQLEMYNPDSDVSIKTNNINSKAPGDTIWSEDFTGGFPAGWTKGGTTNNGADWVINSAAISATYTNTGAIASTSGGNHMLYFGETITPIADRDAYFQTSAIALTGQPAVTVVFQEKFRLCCASAAQLNLVVSTDPTFTSNVQTFDARGAVAINAMSADPLIKSINISAIAGGVNGNIYLRFHWASGASHYFWMVDDIAVIETPSNDLVGFNGFYGSQLGLLPYTRIPVAQNQPIVFSQEVTNVGAATQTGTIVTASINSGAVYAGTSTPISLPTLTSDSLSPPAFTPATTVGVPHTLELIVSSDFTDFNPTDNVEAFAPFEISQYIYALDNFATTPGNGGGPRPAPSTSVEYEAGNFFDIVANDNVHKIDVVIGTNPVNVGQTIDAVLYDASGTAFVELGRTAFYTVTNADLGKKVSLDLVDANTGLPLPVAVTAGSFYFAAVHAFTEFYYGISGSSPSNTSRGGVASLIYYPNMVNPNTNENFFTTQTPMVRLNFDAGNSVEELSNNTSFSVFPNPSNGDFNISLNSQNAEMLTLTVNNIVGQTVMTKQVRVAGQTNETISLAGFDKGVYFLTIDNNKEKQTVKLIV